MKKNKVFYLFIFLLSLSFVYLHGGSVPWSIFYFVLLLPLISFINLYIVFKRFTYKEETNESNYVKGANIKYTCSFVIEYFLPIAYVTLYIKSPETYLTDEVDVKHLLISSKKSSHFTYRIKCRYRGKYDMGIQKIELTDMLNLFTLTYTPSLTNMVTVFPKIKRVFEASTQNITMSQKQLSFFYKNKGDESTVNLRDYMYGDSSKLIHWKLSAKLDELLVREKEHVLDTQIIMAIDLNRVDMVTKKRIIYEDLLIEEAIATAHYFIRRNIPVDVVFNYEGIKNVHAETINDFYKVYKILSEVPFTKEADLKSVLFDFLSNKEKINTIYVFSLTLRKQVVNNLMALRSLGKQLTVKYCVSENKADTYLEINGVNNEKLIIVEESENLYYE